MTPSQDEVNTYYGLLAEALMIAPDYGAVTFRIDPAARWHDGQPVTAEDVVWSAVQSHLAPAGGPQDAEAVIGLQAKRALRAGSPVGPRDLASPQVIARNDMVEVAYINDGVELTVTGKATRNASAGEAVPILNVQSNRTIDAVAVAPGRAIAGPAAQIARRNPQQFAAR
ncbi:MAG: flagella basal body P-ring formation protein FlgA [Brevundimonas diminuta]|nr:MAG: flagella basal body P-ring formation protein FlgA [Brevundimonas diminuta]